VPLPPTLALPAPPPMFARKIAAGFLVITRRLFRPPFSVGAGCQVLLRADQEGAEFSTEKLVVSLSHGNSMHAVGLLDLLNLPAVSSFPLTE